MRTLTDTARDMADRLRLRVSKRTGYQTSNGRRRVAIADLPFYYVEGGDPSFSEGGAPGYKRRLAERRRALLFGVLALALALPANAMIETTSTTPRWTWTAATGPISGYNVYLSRNGLAFEPVILGGPDIRSLQVQSAVGDVVIVKVAAWTNTAVAGKAMTVDGRRITEGPHSQESIPVKVVAQASPWRLVVGSAPGTAGTRPLSGEVLAGDQWIYLLPEENVARVDFWLDGTFFDEELRAPWEFFPPGGDRWNTKSVADGSHTIRTRVTLTNGSTHTFETAFTVKNQTPAPPPVVVPPPPPPPQPQPDPTGEGWAPTQLWVYPPGTTRDGVLYVPAEQTSATSGTARVRYEWQPPLWLVPTRYTIEVEKLSGANTGRISRYSTTKTSYPMECAIGSRYAVRVAGVRSDGTVAPYTAPVRFMCAPAAGVPDCPPKLTRQQQLWVERMCVP